MNSVPASELQVNLRVWGAEDAVLALHSVQPPFRVGRRPTDTGAVHTWILRGEQLDDQLPRLRRLLKGTELRWSESWHWLERDKRLSDASLLRLYAPPIEATVVDSPVSWERCGACGWQHWRWSEDGHIPIRVQVAGQPCPDLFSTSDVPLCFISDTLLSLLDASGLASGIRAVPVESIGTNKNESISVILPTVSLGWPQAPFGDVVPPCRACGYFQPRYSLYYTYARHEELVGWFSVKDLSPSAVVVDQRVFHWLAHRAPVDTVRYDRSKLRGHRLGWYPDELLRAFVPEKYRSGEGDGLGD